MFFGRRLFSEALTSLQPSRTCQAYITLTSRCNWTWRCTFPIALLSFCLSSAHQGPLNRPLQVYKKDRNGIDASVYARTSPALKVGAADFPFCSPPSCSCPAFSRPGFICAAGRPTWARAGLRGGGDQAPYPSGIYFFPS